MAEQTIVMKLSSPQIRIGVIGIGHLGTYHLQKYATLPNCVIVGVADTMGERAQEAAERHNCQAFADYRELIGKVDAVSIAVPTICHHAVARDFLAAGIDVLLEKPMTVTLEEADELISLAEQYNALLQIGFVERFNPAITALRSYLHKPLFIEAHRLHPFFLRGTDVDVILDLMIHDLDIILSFVQAPPVTVEAVGVSVLSDKVDIANARISFQNGSVANITASRVTNKHMQKIRFFGLNGYHSVDYRKRALISLQRSKMPDGSYNIVQNPVEIPGHDPLEEEIRAFVHAVLARQQPSVSGKEGRQSLELALRILERIQEGSRKANLSEN